MPDDSRDLITATTHSQEDRDTIPQRPMGDKAPASTVRRGMGGHQTACGQSDTWLTPRHILDALGKFDLDPCAAPNPRPWPTAREHLARPEHDGYRAAWRGRVWMNPPYGPQTARWLARLAAHGRGTALTFARTDTRAFHDHVFPKADALLFLKGRVRFHRHDGSLAGNGGAPSVLIAYGLEDAESLAGSGLEGALVPLSRIAALGYGIDVPDLPAWREVVSDAIRSCGGRASLQDLYAALQAHPKRLANPNWRAKVRQIAPRVGQRVAQGQYALDLVA